MARQPDDGQGESVSKAFAYRDAESKLGAKADLELVRSYILQNFGMDMDKAQISQYRSIQKKRKRRQRRQKKYVPATNSPAAAPLAPVILHTPVIAFVSDLRDWEAKIGADKICEIIKALYAKGVSDAK